jgi:L-ascorbate metabolism protein UlaG (beta-lactamase superfamily)
MSPASLCITRAARISTTANYATATVDVFLAGVAGRQVTPYYWERVLPRLDPRILVPTHYDNFFSPLGRPQDFVRRINLADLPREVARVAPDVRVAALRRVDV